MDKELSKILADCLSDIEAGASVEDCLKRHSGRAADLRPQLEMLSAVGGAALVQPSTAAFNRGRQAMQGALAPAPAGFSPFAAARHAPAWATMMAAVAGAVILLGGAAGASAALGGPDVAGDVFDAVGVTNGDGGISHSSASDRGLACANPNAFEGAANSEDKAQNAEDAHSKEKCPPGNCETGGEDTGDTEETGAEVEDGEAEVENEDADVEDDQGEDPGEQGNVNGNANGNGNDNANGNGNANANNANGNGNGNANANGQNNDQPCAEDGDDEGIENSPDNADKGRDNANENASEGAGNAEDGSENGGGNENGGQRTPRGGPSGGENGD